MVSATVDMREVKHTHVGPILKNDKYHKATFSGYPFADLQLIDRFIYVRMENKYLPWLQNI